MTSLNPVFTCGDQIVEAITLHRDMSSQGGQRAGHRDAGQGGHPGGQAPRPAVSARALGRHAPARHDRHGPLHRAGAAHRRRAHHGPRRHHPGPDPGAHEGAARAERHGHHAHHPRPGRGRRDGRRGRRSCTAARSWRAPTHITIYEHPHHPYTKGLLASIPKLGEKRQRLEVIRGVVPNPLNLPSGCLFKRRCPMAMPVCDTPPPVRQLEDGPHLALLADPGRRAARGGRERRPRGCRRSCCRHLGRADGRVRMP